MKQTTIMAAAVAACFSTGLAQQAPSAPEAQGLMPQSETIYVNRQTTNVFTINNNNTESLGVAVVNNGNVVVGWEDDGPEENLEYLGAVWTMFSPSGALITPETSLTSVLFPGESITNRFLSYFRPDGSAVFGGTSWGPKIHANLFGEGFGMGATSYLLGEEVPNLAAFAGTGDFPSVQLLSDTGTPLGIATGVTSDYAARDGDIRIGDWEFLSNGNIVIVGESRQAADLASLYGGETEDTHAIFRIVTPDGTVIKPETLVSETPTRSEIWHGVGVTSDGFAVRFSTAGVGTVRMFDNSGNPTSANIDLGTLTENSQPGGGGRGDGVGFHGNGRDAYVVANASGLEVWVTVLSTNGTVRYSKSVIDDVTLLNVGRVDAAIDADGSVIVVFAGTTGEEQPLSVMGRRLDPAGEPLGGTFYISEKEVPGEAMGAAQSPRIAWRDGQVAVTWESNNDAETLDPDLGEPKTVVAVRLFSTGPAQAPEFSIGLNFGANEPDGAATGSLATNDVAGVSSVAQANWNNLPDASGTNTTIVADVGGMAEPTSVTVAWTSAGTWSSTGRTEENNAFPTNSTDWALLTGYLDTGNATTSRVSIANIPTELTESGYDLYVYASGGVGGRGGSYRLLNAADVPLRDYVRAQSGTNLTQYVEAPQNLGAPNPSGARVFGVGNYLVFRGLNESSLVLEAVTGPAADGLGFGGTPRAPINAIQLVAPTSGSLEQDVTRPGDSIVSSHDPARSPENEQVANAIDNNSATKYLNFGEGTDTSPPFEGPVGLTVTPSGGASIVSGLALTSANDAPERDPASYRLEGSKDGTNFVLISEGAIPAFQGRFVRQEIAIDNNTFQATLSGAAERPDPVTTTGTGSGILVVNGNEVNYDIQFTGLSAAASAGHIHGPAGLEEAAGVMVPFPNVSGTEGTLTGTLTLDDTQLADLRAGRTYVNIHTGNNPGGEIRGQIEPASFTTYRLTFPTVADPAAANSMQIAEVELLGRSVGGPAPGPSDISISRGDNGQLQITFEGTLHSAPTVDGPFVPVEGATSPYTVTPEGAAQFFIVQ